VVFDGVHAIAQAQPLQEGIEGDSTHHLSGPFLAAAIGARGDLLLIQPIGHLREAAALLEQIEPVVVHRRRP